MVDHDDDDNDDVSAKEFAQGHKGLIRLLRTIKKEGGVVALGRVAGAAGGTPSKVRKEKSMAEIRRLVAEGYSHNEIMEQLKLPARTYFRYLSEVFEHDWQLLKQENNAAMLALKISRAINTFNTAIRKLEEIANSPKTKGRQKLKFLQKVSLSCILSCESGQIRSAVVVFG